MAYGELSVLRFSQEDNLSSYENYIYMNLWTTQIGVNVKLWEMGQENSIRILNFSALCIKIITVAGSYAPILSIWRGGLVKKFHESQT